MEIRLRYKGKPYKADLSKPVDISMPLGQVNCFYAPEVEIKPYQSGDFIGSVKAGSPVNFFNVSFNPHGNGTHTECMGHITEEHQSLNQELKQFHFVGRLVSVSTEQKGEDRIVSVENFQKAYAEELPEALILRTLPNDVGKLNKQYSGTNPPYLAVALIEYFVEKGVKHLLLDLPSVDREDDGGAILAHKSFWDFPSKTRLDCTITELIFVPDEVEDGVYLLNLQIAPFELDASPSKPVLYKMNREDEVRK